MLGFSEPAEHLAIRDAVASIGGKYGHGYFADCARRGEFTTDLWDEIFAGGFGGVNLPQEYGGGGGGLQEMSLVIEELSAAGCPLIFLIVAGMCGPLINEFGTEEQKREWLPGIADGARRMAFATTEAGAGSNIYNTTTRAEPAGDGWMLNGAKQFITGVDIADAMLVVCRSGTDDRGRTQLSLLIVDTDDPGVTFHPIDMEIKAPDRQFGVFFDDVRLPADRLIGQVPHQGFKQIFSGLNPERVNVAAQAVGLGRYFLSKAVAYAGERNVWGVPVGSYQGISHPMSEAKIHLDLADLMKTKGAWLFDHGLPEVGQAASAAKLAAADACLECFDVAIQVHGGNAFATEYGLGDLWGLARLMKSAPVSREMVLNFVAQQSLELPRSY
ncbi:acyl-CoA dehydrogenase family protein [Nakamurella lactea]|uniref:acyl-CoA dehydrogenase family protein n=1 Tax=Nakamurella lactea TaxID=459515 RepID=UPI000405FCA7|nr:acyl-CoA dehydrogenase family protein [Nakamurella lactea]